MGVEFWGLPIAVTVCGYLLGSFPTAYILGKLLRGIDIREHGSGNMGAANTSLLFGLPYGLLVAATDIFKGMAAVWLAKALVPDWSLAPYLAGALAVVGHVYPVFVGFRGGEGAATVIGMGLAMSLSHGLAMIGIVFGLGLITNYVAIGSIAMFFSFALFTHLRGESIEAVVVAILVAALCTYRHKINIVRLAHGEEEPDRTAVVNWFKRRFLKQAA